MLITAASRQQSIDYTYCNADVIRQIGDVFVLFNINYQFQPFFWTYNRAQIMILSLRLLNK